MNEIEVLPNLFIPIAELKLTTARSSGAGGQNVNKVNSKVSLHFNVITSTALTEEQKDLILSKLAHRINQAGELWLESQEHRSQLANKEAAFERLVGLLRQALKQERPRRATKIPYSARRKRLDAKKKRSGIKEGRQFRAE